MDLVNQSPAKKKTIKRKEKLITKRDYKPSLALGH